MLQKQFSFILYVQKLYVKYLPEISLIWIFLASGNFFCNDKCKIFSPPLRVATSEPSITYFLTANYNVLRW